MGSPPVTPEAEVEQGVTDRAAFSDEEWNLLVQLPRWVAVAASAAEHDSARKTHAEEEAGLLAIADGRQSNSAFVALLAAALVDVYDAGFRDANAPVIDVHHPEAGLTEVVARTRAAAALLMARAEGADAAAYRGWLLSITDAVIGAVRSGDVLGLGGETISAAERRFRDRLTLALQQA
jgi:hypothetical protein